MENLKNEFCSELVRSGFDSRHIQAALSALAIVLHGYNITTKAANIAVYDGFEATTRLIDFYVACKVVENCSNTFCKCLKTMLPKLFSYCNKGAKEINSFDVRAFLAYWKEDRGICGKTLEKYKQMYSGFFDWLVSEGYLSKNPCSSISKIKEEHKERESLSQLELEIIRSSLKNAREKMLIEVLYSTGCRASELIGIKLSDLNLFSEKPTVKLFGKGKKERTGCLNAKAVVAIQEYLASRKQQSDYLYCSLHYPYGKCKSYATVEQAIKKIGERVAGRIHHKLHPHLFRHTTATIAMRNGMPVQEIQMLLGHSNIATTMIYANTDKSQMQNDHIRFVN